MMNKTEKTAALWERQVAEAEKVKELIQSEGWDIFKKYLKNVYERKILDSFRRIPGNTDYDVGFRILQGEYQMLNHTIRIPNELIEIGEQAKNYLAKLSD